MAICPSCSSSGTQPCDTCRGSGFVDGEECTAGCNNGVKRCITCNGKGTIEEE